MNILRDFTFKSIKLNKRRTIVTIIGIILSTALICCVAGMFTSFSKTMVNSIIEQGGDYHVAIYDIKYKDVELLRNNKNIKNIYIEANKGVIVNDSLMYLNLVAKDNSFLENYSLFDGRLPESSNEVLLPYDYKNLLGKNVYFVDSSIFDNEEELEEYEDVDHDNIDINDILNTNGISYKVVGILSEKYYMGQALTTLGKMDLDDSVSIKVKYKNIRKTYKLTEELFSNYGYSYNQELLNFSFVPRSANSMKTLYMLVGIVLGIIVVSSVFVIRNSFEISITEKMRQYGMLASIGATKKQIRKSVLYEGFLLGIIAIPCGILLGYIAIYTLILFSNFILGDLISDNVKFVVSVPFVAILLSIILGSVTILFSSLKSAYKAGKVSPIAAIRSNTEIKIKNKKLRTPKIINKLFGIGGVVAYKNLKRSKKKYRTTVISLVVSITIFISLYSFMDNLFSISKFLYKNIYFNMSVVKNYSYDDSIDTDDYYKNIIKDYKELTNKISKLDNVKDYMSVRRSGLLLENYGKNIYFISVGENMYNKILNEYHLKYEDTKDKVIYIENLYHRDGKTIIKTYDFKVGDILSISDNYGNKYSTSIINVNKLDKYDIQNFNFGDGIFLVSDEYFDKVASISEQADYEILVKASNATKVEKTINDFNLENLEITNIDKVVKEINNIVLWISVFLYGFIIVISLIGVTNIFNTITTNMNLRSKEFAMLKSVGMTTKEFNRMIRLESILYGLKSLLYGCTFGTILSYLISMATANSLELGFKFPITAIIISIIFIALVVGLIMKYSLSKINKQNIIETIRQDNI